MELWQIWLIVGIILLTLEMFTPMLFFASIGVGCFLAGFAAYFGASIPAQVGFLAIASILLIILVRPLLMSKMKNNKTKTGVSRYEGMTVKVIEFISNSQNTGRVKLYDEEWNARSENNEDIEAGSNAKIVRLQDMTLYVNKVEE